MKKWIVKNWIALAEVFGWSIPGRIRRLVTAGEFEELLLRERGLTQALRGGLPRAHETPAHLGTRIERGIRESSRERDERRSLRGIYLIPVAGLAMITLGALMVIFIQPEVPVQSPGEEAPPVILLSDAGSLEKPIGQVVSRIPGIGDTLESSTLLLRPLDNEKDRLAADMANALRFVAESVIPNQYLPRVNANLSTLQEQMVKSI